MITAEDGIISLLNYKDNSLKATPSKPSEVLLNKLQKLDNRYRKDVRDWLASTSKDKYKAVKGDFSVSEELSEANTTPLFEAWGDKAAELNLDYAEKLSSLTSILPTNQSVTLFGVDDRPPSLFEQKKWLVALDIFKNPVSIIEKLNSGILSGLEVEALAMFYPSILETIQQSLIEGISELRGKNVAFNSDKMRLVNSLLQVPRLSPEKLQAFQAQFTVDKEGTNVKTDIESTQTPTQRVSFK